MRTGLKTGWAELLARIQAPLAGDLQDVRERMKKLLFCDFKPINEVLVHLFSTNGKMIRPTLLLIAADRTAARHEHLVSCGAAVEIIHTASLVHDDSIDKATCRRGIETLNAKWNHRTSVIIGDYLLARAFNEITGLGDIRLTAEMTAACRSLATGEMRQMSMEGDLGVTEEDYFQYIREKTGSLFSAACSVASLLSGGFEHKGLKEFGMLFGSIFQITDDLLDYIGLALETGKPTGLDLKERKMTLPLIHAFSRMDSRARGEVKEAFSRETLENREVARVRELVIEFGGIDYAWSRVNELAHKARSLVDNMPGELASRLKELVEVIVERDR